MIILKIGTLNCQNTKISQLGGIMKNGKNNALILANYIEKSNYDILGTQELIKPLARNINKYLNNYQLYGGYKFGNSFIVNNISFLSNYNENNAIATKDKVLEVHTYRLPWFPKKIKDIILSIKKKSMRPRIATVVILERDGFKICSINTHLDYLIEEVQKRQLKKILNIIDKYKNLYPIVLTGDFNMEVEQEAFSIFITCLNNLKLKRVDIIDKTNARKYRNKTAIDHIFVPDNWNVKNYGTTEELMDNKFTDHKELYVEVEIS